MTQTQATQPQATQPQATQPQATQPPSSARPPVRAYQVSSNDENTAVVVFAVHNVDSVSVGYVPGHDPLMHGDARPAWDAYLRSVT